MAVSFINGAEEKGMMCYVKHFGLNEQETYRSLMIHNWATEQAMRENYLRSFEIPIKEASAEIKYISEENGRCRYKNKKRYARLRL